MSLFSWLEELFVEMPPRATAAVLDAAVKFLKTEIVALPKHDNRCADVRFMDTGNDGGTRFSIHLPDSAFSSNPSGKTAGIAKAAASAQSGAEKTFSEMLVEFVGRKCGGNAPMVYKRAGISRQAFSRIVSSSSARVDKLTAMRLCVGLQLPWDEADGFLRAAGHAFSDSIPIDKVFAYCIRNGIWNIFDITDIAEACGLKAFDIA